MVKMYLRSVARGLVLFLTVWIPGNEGYVANGSVLPPPSRCDRLVEAGMAVYRSNILEDPPFPLPSEQEVSDMLCSLADARTLDDVTAVLVNLEPNMPRQVQKIMPVYYVSATSIFQRYFGGIDLVEERIHFVEAFVEFAHGTNLGDETVPYEIAYDFTSNWVNVFGDDFLRKMDVYPVNFEVQISPDDVIHPEMLARALSELELDDDPDFGTLSETFAGTSGLSVVTSRTILRAIKDLRNERARGWPLTRDLMELSAAAIPFLRTADEFGLLDLRASYD